MISSRIIWPFLYPASGYSSGFPIIEKAGYPDIGQNIKFFVTNFLTLENANVQLFTVVYYGEQNMSL